MSAMENMLVSMLQKAIPSEVLELLSPEKINEFGERINAFVIELRENQQEILNNLDAILNRLEIVEKGLNNVGSENSSGNGRPALTFDGNGSGSVR